MHQDTTEPASVASLAAEERNPSRSRSLSVLPAITPQAQKPEQNPRSVARYQRVRRLAEGGSGQVDIWHDQDIDRPVAVKRLKVPGNSSAVAHFISEVQTVGKLEHPGIVPIYDVGVDGNGDYFFVMKHVEGETLEQIIAKLRAADPAYLRRFSYDVRTQIFMQILRAVQYAHDKGFLHCDIKPAKQRLSIYRRMAGQKNGNSRIPHQFPAVFSHN